MTWLCQRNDFPELVEAAAGDLGIPAAIVEKDYYVTEALRPIAASFGDQVLFKGGTSLSKGWKLIDRFSEDIDLYVARDYIDQCGRLCYGAYPDFTEVLSAFEQWRAHFIEVHELGNEGA